MSTESLTYADLAGRLGTSREAARSLVRRLKLPRHAANDGTVRVNIDCVDIRYKRVPRRSPRGHRADFDALKSQIEQLQAEVAKLETENGAIEAIAARRRADFERERDRSDKLAANAMRLTATAMSARLKATRLKSEIAARRSQFWMRLRTCPQGAASQQFQANALPKAPEQLIVLAKSVPAAAGRVRMFAWLAGLVILLVVLVMVHGWK